MVKTVILANQQKINSLLMILSLFISVIPINQILAFSGDEFSQENDDFSETFRKTPPNIPKLMKHRTSNTTITSPTSIEVNAERANSSSVNISAPSFAIGSQEGLGGGNYIVDDSLNITNSEAIAISNTIASSETRQDDFTISVPNGFINGSGIFNITNIKAEFDVRAIENSESLNLYVDSNDSGNGWYEVAMQFNVTEDYVNLSSLYVKIVSEQVGFDVPSGELLVVNSSWDSGNSRWKPNETEILSTISLSTSTGWTIPPLTFSENITLRGDRNYFVILNDTTSADKNAYWKWGVQRDLTTVGGDNYDEGAFYYKWLTHAEDSWTYGTINYQLDLNLVISVLPVEKSGGKYPKKTYSDPREIELLYNTSVEETNLTRFNWFEWNATSDNIHRFRTNTSVSFDLSWIINLTSVNNPLTVSSSYMTTNNTVTHWNLMFPTDSVTTSYNIRNRTITIQNIPNDWNGSAIYHDGDLVYNSTNTKGLNASVTYTNQSNVMIINASTLADATDWNTSFDAPNYLLNFTLWRGGSPLRLPYRTYVMNDYNLTFNVGATGNLTYWIDYPNGLQVLKEKNINNTHTTFSDEWNINDSLNLTTNINGTYSLQAFWNNSDATKVGTFTRKITMYINTSLTTKPEMEAEVISGELFNVKAYYKAIHNDSYIKNATIWCNSSWEALNVTMTPLANDTYKTSLDTTGQPAGSYGTLNITTQLPWFVNWTVLVNVFFLGNSSLTVNTSDNLSLEWRENITLLINYNITGDSGITGATVIFTYDTDSQNATEVSGVYYFQLNSTDIGGVGTYTNLLIKANHSNYVTREWYFNLTISPRAMVLDELLSTHSNETVVDTLQYGETYSFFIFLKDNRTGEPVNGTPVTPLPTNVTFTGMTAPGNHSFSYNAFEVGTFPTLKIIFSRNNYENCSYLITFDVDNREFTLDASLSTHSNDTTVDTLQYGETYSFFIFLNDTRTGEPVNSTPVTPLPTNITFISVNSPGNHSFSYDAFEVGMFPALEIIFSRNNYDNYSYLITFEVANRKFTLDTSLSTNGNETVVDTLQYGEIYSFFIFLNDSRTGIPVNGTPNIPLPTNITFTGMTVPGNHSFSYEAFEVGTFPALEIIFSGNNYNNCSYLITFLVANREFTLDASLSTHSNETIVDTVQYGETYSFFIFLNDSRTEEPVNSTLVTPLTTNISFTGINAPGNHSFSYDAFEVGTFPALEIIFSRNNYLNCSYLITFEVTNRDFTLDTTLSTHGNETIVDTLQYGETYSFFIFLNDSRTGEPVNGTPITPLPTNITFVGMTAPGNHSFSYAAFAVGMFPLLEIIFSRNKYDNCSYLITFEVANREFTLDTTLSTHENETVVDTLQYGEIYSFFIFLNDSRTGVPVNGTPISPLPTNITFVGMAAPGNHSFSYAAFAVGTFPSLEIIFSRNNYNNISYSISFDVANREFTLDTVLSTHDNETTVDTLQYGETYSFFIFLNDSRTGVPVNGTPITPLPTNITFVGMAAPGNHSFSYDAFEVGMFPSLEITLSRNNYGNIIYSIAFDVDNREFTLDVSLSTLDNETTVDTLQYGETYSFFIFLNDSRTGEPVNTTPVTPLPTNITFTSIPVSGNHSFSYDAFAIGTFPSLEIIFSHNNYYNCSYLITFIVDTRKFSLDEILSSNSNDSTVDTLQYGETYSFFIFLNDSRTGEPVNGTPFTPLPTNITFVGLAAPGNHSFSYNAFEVGMFPSLEIILSWNNYDNISYSISFDVADREFTLDASLSTHDNETVVDTLQYGETYPFFIFLNDSRTGEPVNATPITPLPTNITFIGITVLGNHSFSYDAFEVGTFPSIEIIFSHNNYYNCSYLISFDVNNRKFSFDTSISTHDNETIVDTLQYGEIYPFFIFLNDSRTGDPINGTPVAPLPTNITFTGMITPGNHSFSYDAFEVGIFPALEIIFKHNNYDNCSYLITFIVDTRKFSLDEILSSNSNDSTVDTLQYGETYSFFIFLNDSRTGEPVNGTPFTPLPTNITFVGLAAPGNHSFSYNAFAVGTFPSLEIIFGHNNYDNCSYLITFTIYTRKFSLDASLSSHTNETTVDTLQYSETYSFFIFLNDSRTGEPVNGTPVTPLPTNITFTGITVSGNHTFSYKAFEVGTFPVLKIIFIRNNYLNCSYLITFDVANRKFTLDVSLSTHDNETIVDTLQYGETYPFFIFLNDSRTGEPINGTLISPLPTNITFLGIFNSGNHSFSYDASEVGTFPSLEIIFSGNNYLNCSYLITFDVAYRVFILDGSRSTHTNDSIIESLQYGETYMFFIYLNDSRTGNPVNGTPVTPLPTNVTFVGMAAPGNHSFSYNAFEVGMFPSLEIIFNRNYYYNCLYLISFDVSNREFTLDVLLSRHNNETVIDTLQYGETYFFFIFLNDSRTWGPVNAAPVTPLPTNVTFAGMTAPGNHSFSYDAFAVGTFPSLEITFSRNNYINCSYLISFNVANREFTFDVLLSTHDNETTVDTLQYGESYLFFIFLNDSRTGEPVNGTPITQLPTNITFLGMATSGNHSFSYDASEVGTFPSLEIILNRNNYDNCSYLITFTVDTRKFSLDTLLSSHVNDTTVDTLQYGDIYYFFIFLNDSRTGEPVNGTIVTALPTNITFAGMITPGNHSFSYNAFAVGTFPALAIIFSRNNYDNCSYLVTFTVDTRKFSLDELLSSHANETTVDTLQYGDTYSFFIFLYDSRTGEPVNVTPLTPLPINITFTGMITQGNHSFSYDAFEVGTFPTLVIIFSRNNYDNCSYLITFTVDTRKFSLDELLSSHANETTVDTLQYGDTYYFFIFLNDSQTGEPVNGTPETLLPTNISFSGVTTPGNHSFSYEAFELGTFSTLEIIFVHNNYDKYSYVITFIVNKREFFIDDNLSRPVNNSAQTIQVLFDNNYNFSVFLRDNRTRTPINVSTSSIVLPEHISFSGVILTGNHTFKFIANQLGTFPSLAIVFTLPKYHNVTYIISFNVFNRTMYVNGSLSNPITGVLIDSLQYGEIFYFNVFICDNETNDPVNITSFVSLPTNILFLGVINGNHTFSYYASEVGMFLSLEIIFSLLNYEDCVYTISFSVTNREFSLDELLSKHNNDSTIDILQYGETYSFFIFLNDSRTGEPVNGTPVTPLPTNIIFTGMTASGNHSFSYSAFEVGTFPSLEITFSRINYNSCLYLISFDVANREITFDALLSSHDNETIVDMLQYGETYLFFIFLNDTRTGEPVNTTPVTLLPTNITFTGMIAPGNHSFSYDAYEVGIFPALEITLGRNNYDNCLYLITFNVTSRLFILDKSLSTHDNDTTVDTLQFGETYSFFVFLNDSRTGIPVNATPVTPLPTNITFTEMIAPGNHSFSYDAFEVGIFPILTIIFSRNNYDNCLYLITFNVTNRLFILDESLSTYDNDTAADTLQFGEIHSFFVFLNDSRTGVPVNTTPVTPLPTNITFTGMIAPGNHSFSYDAFEVGKFPVLTIIFSRNNYDNCLYLITFNVTNRIFTLNEQLSKHTNGSSVDILQYGETYPFFIFLNDSRTGEPVSATPITPLSTNITFTGVIAPGNHSFSYDAFEVGVFPALAIIFSRNNYNNCSYLITFSVDTRKLSLDARLSSHTNETTVDALQYGDTYTFFIFMNDSRTGEPVNATPVTPLPTNVIFVKISRSGNLTFSYITSEVGVTPMFKLILSYNNYDNYSYMISFIISRRELFIDEEESKPINNSMQPIQVTFGSNYNFCVFLKDNSTKAPLNISLMFIVVPEYISFSGITTSGNHSFTFISSELGILPPLNIIFQLPNYNNATYTITFHVIQIQTYEPLIKYQKALIVGETLKISCEDWFSKPSNESVPFGELQIFNGIISIPFSPTNINEFPFEIGVSTENFRQGSYNLALILTSYGYEQQVLNLSIQIIGRDVLITIEIYPAELVKGLEFTIKATLEYAPLQTNLVGRGASVSVLTPLEGVEVTFEVEILYDNGSTMTFRHITHTNLTGEAKFVVDGKYTLEAEMRRRITVTSAATASGKSGSIINEENVNFLKQTDKFPSQIIILIICIITSFSLLVGSIIFIRRKQRQKKQLPILISGEPDSKQPSDDQKVEREEQMLQEDRGADVSTWMDYFPLTILEYEKEIKFIFNLVLERKGRWAGCTSLNYLTKSVPDEISLEKLKILFNILPEQTDYFTKEKNSIIITQEGKVIASTIQNDK